MQPSSLYLSCFSISTSCSVWLRRAFSVSSSLSDLPLLLFRSSSFLSFSATSSCKCLQICWQMRRDSSFSFSSFISLQMKSRNSSVVVTIFLFIGRNNNAWKRKYWSKLHVFFMKLNLLIWQKSFQNVLQKNCIKIIKCLLSLLKIMKYHFSIYLDSAIPFSYLIFFSSFWQTSSSVDFTLKKN